MVWTYLVPEIEPRCTSMVVTDLPINLNLRRTVPEFSNYRKFQIMSAPARNNQKFTHSPKKPLQYWSGSIGPASVTKSCRPKFGDMTQKLVVKPKKMVVILIKNINKNYKNGCHITQSQYHFWYVRPLIL